MSNIPSVFIGQASRLTTAQLASSNRQAIFLSRIKPLRSCFEFLRKIVMQLFLNLFPVFFPVLIRHIARYAPHKNK